MLMDIGPIFSGYPQSSFIPPMMFPVEDLSGPIKVVNLKWRELDSQFRSINGKLSRNRALLGEMSMHPEEDPKKEAAFLRKQSGLVETIVILEEERREVSIQRASAGKHILFEEMSEEEQFKRLAPDKKQLVDTIKMIAYRAETALSTVIKPQMKKPNEARTLIRALFKSEADLLPNSYHNKLLIRIHYMSTPQGNLAIQSLIDHLHEAEFVYPGTKMKSRYALGSQIDSDLEVNSNS